MSKFDRLDQAIIQNLNRDARISSARLARDLSASQRTINNRIKRLIDHRVIFPIAVVNPHVFGYQIVVDIFCELEVGYQAEALKVLREMPEISYIAISTGDQDISLQAFFRDSDSMQRFITERLHQVPGMQRTRTILLPSIIKDNYQWLPPDEAFSDNNEPYVEGR